MIRSPRYPSTGDTIHADALAMISPEGRTFSIFQTDDIEMHGLVSSGRNGLLFYDNDREIFLHRPVFADILSSSLTPLQVGVINEFSRIESWKEFGKFLLKLDKTIILDQFRQYLSPENPNFGIFRLRAKDFCEREGIHITDEDLDSPEALKKLSTIIGSLESLKSGFFISSVPDITLPAPDPALCQTQSQRRASRWLNVAGKENQIDQKVRDRLDGLDRKAAVHQIVEKYMSTVEKWEGSPLLKTEGDASLSRADLEDFLTGSATIYCPSPLGWTPRLRFAFYCPPEFKEEPIDVKIEVIASLERKIGEESGLDVKLLYIPESNCLVLDNLGTGGGGPEVPCTFENGQQAETGILNLDTSQITGLSRAVISARDSMGPDPMEKQIENARMSIEEMRQNESMSASERNLEFWESMDHEDAVAPEM